MHKAVRIAAVATIAAVGLTCAEQSTTGAHLTRIARLAITPIHDEAPEGGPQVDVHRIKGQLTRLNGTDSVLTESLVQGDSAILEFSNVLVRGDSTAYVLTLEAFDAQEELVFKAAHFLKVKPGENAPESPTLQYAAADKIADALEIKSGSTVVDSLQLDWAGADPTNAFCLNKIPSTTAITAQQLQVKAMSAGQALASVRVGWRSRDPRVVTVDSTGLVRAQCSNKSTYVVARTFLNVVDSVLIRVAAPAFSFVMSPDSVTLERGMIRQFTALVVDENSNTTAATQPTWTSSDVTRATVSSTGMVQALRNGRVHIAASGGNRVSIGVVQVVRPKAAFVKVIPGRDTMAFGQVQQFFARAFDAAGRVIPDAAPFQWSTNNTAIAIVDPSTGVVTANPTTSDTVFVKASVDGKLGFAVLRVLPSLPTAAVSSFVKDASSPAPLANATVSGPGGSTTTAADGSFTLAVKSGDSVTVTDSGYVPVTIYDVPAFPGRTIQLPDVALSPVGPQGATGTMTSKVVNALTGSGVSGMTIKAYAGLHASPSPRRPDATPVATATSDANGIFSITAPPGAYTFLASATGYSEATGVGTSVANTTRQTPAMIVPPTIPGGGLFTMVTWGDCVLNTAIPCDLDAYLTGPTAADSTLRFQVHSGNRSFVDDPTLAAPDTIAVLDADKSTSPGRGPEVIGLRTTTPGVYKFYVRDIQNTANSTSSALSNSGVRVDVFQDNRVIASFFPPTNTVGQVWEVFSYDGARIIPKSSPQITFNPATVLP